VGVVLFLNVFAVLFLCGRRLFLSDTGRKLAHVEKQLRTGDAVLATSRRGSRGRSKAHGARRLRCPARRADG
jgi:hypothetical protein